jgi:flagellar basal-body rod protein FlgB
MDINTLTLASALATHAGARQRLLSENVAHADTPGYRARDLAPFAEAVEAAPAFAAKRTRPGHIGFGAEPHGFAPQETAAFGAATPNGNSVSLEDQMMRAAEVRQQHEMALGVYAKSLAVLRATLSQR